MNVFMLKQVGKDLWYKRRGGWVTQPGASVWLNKAAAVCARTSAQTEAHRHFKAAPEMEIVEFSMVEECELEEITNALYSYSHICDEHRCATEARRLRQLAKKLNSST